MTINQDTFLDYVMGALTPEEEREVAVHLNENPDDATHVRDLFEAMMEVAFEQEPEVVPETATESLLARIRKTADTTEPKAINEQEAQEVNVSADNLLTEEVESAPELSEPVKLSLDSLRPTIEAAKPTEPIRKNQYKLDEGFFEDTSKIPSANFSERGSLKTPQAVIQDRPALPRWIAGFAAAASLVLFTYMGFQIQGDNVARQLAQLCDQTNVTCDVLLSETNESLGTIAVRSNNALFIALNDTAPEGQVYQAWEINEGNIISLGTFSERSLDIATPLTEGSVFGVTLEPDGGSEQPTSAPFVVVPLSS